MKNRPKIECIPLYLCAFFLYCGDNTIPRVLKDGKTSKIYHTASLSSSHCVIYRKSSAKNQLITMKYRQQQSQSEKDKESADRSTHFSKITFSKLYK